MGSYSDRDIINLRFTVKCIYNYNGYDIEKIDYIYDYENRKMDTDYPSIDAYIE